jgi:hypothetical protein
MRQRHDTGWKKRNTPGKRKTTINGGELARDLVERGLASRDILDPTPRYRSQRKTDDQH